MKTPDQKTKSVQEIAQEIAQDIGSLCNSAAEGATEEKRLAVQIMKAKLCANMLFLIDGLVKLGVES